MYHFFFFNDTATTEIYTLSLHDALPIYGIFGDAVDDRGSKSGARIKRRSQPGRLEEHRTYREHGLRASDSARLAGNRSEEHTSELQSRLHLVCRLLLEKKTDLSEPSIAN